jgi:uncharacterized protein (DUF2235 family)
MKLCSLVENACQAIAIDEHRRDYDVCLWNPDTAPAQVLEQRWFMGAHCDVGGGYEDRRLSDLTLRWMQDKAVALGLAVDPVTVGAQNYLGEFTDSYARFLGGVYAKKNARHYRAFGGTRFGNETVDESVTQRRKEDRDYEPQNNGLPKLT